jgi:hypothetical protein
MREKCMITLLRQTIAGAKKWLVNCIVNLSDILLQSIRLL